MDEAPSPFLPGTKVQYAWDSTSLSYLKTCPRLYQYIMIDGWSPKNDNIHLRFGIEIHQALHDYEISRSNGLNHDDSTHDTLRALLTRITDWNPDPSMEKKSERVKSKQALVRSTLWYLDKWIDDPAKTLILKDGSPAMEVSFQFNLDWGPIESQPYVLCGHLDRIVDFGGQMMVMDRKTTTSTPSSYYFSQFEPNNQMTLYTLAAQIIMGEPIKGVIIDAIQIGEDFTDFSRSITYRTEDQLDEWTQSLEHWLNVAESYAQAGYWPMNDTTCTMYGGCRFREVCSKSPSVRENFLKAGFERREPWNPMKTR